MTKERQIETLARLFQVQLMEKLTEPIRENQKLKISGWATSDGALTISLRRSQYPAPTRRRVANAEVTAELWKQVLAVPWPRKQLRAACEALRKGGNAGLTDLHFAELTGYKNFSLLRSCLAMFNTPLRIAGVPVRIIRVGDVARAFVVCELPRR